MYISIYGFPWLSPWPVTVGLLSRGAPDVISYSSTFSSDHWRMAFSLAKDMATSPGGAGGWPGLGFLRNGQSRIKTCWVLVLVS